MNIVEQLKRDEGVKLEPYRDSVGKLTIGIGRNLDDVGISMAEAEYLLLDDLARTKTHLDQECPWAESLSEPRYGALLNMAFNLGVHGLLQFVHFLADLKAGSYETAANEMLKSLWAKQVGIRAKRLALQIFTGEWQ